MSIANRLMSITDFLQTGFRNITGAEYNYSLSSAQVVKGYMDFNSLDIFPAVCIFASSVGRSEFADQVTLNMPFSVEALGYVKGEAEVLMDAEKLAADMEKAVYADETMGGLIWDLSLRQEITALADSYGGVYMEITGTTAVNK